MVDSAQTRKKRLDFAPQASVNTTDMSDIKLLTIPEVCGLLNVGRSLLYDLIRKRQLRTIKIGTRTLIRQVTIHKLLVKLESENS